VTFLIWFAATNMDHFSACTFGLEWRESAPAADGSDGLKSQERAPELRRYNQDIKASWLILGDYRVLLSDSWLNIAGKQGDYA